MAYVIERGTEAFQHLERIIADPDTYEIHLDVRPISPTYSVRHIALKRNAGIWTAPLKAAKGPR